MDHTMIVLAAVVALPLAVAGEEPVTAADEQFRGMRDAYVAKFQPLWLESKVSWWEANITGSDSAFARKKAADKALVDLHSDREFFARLREQKANKQVTDPVLRRQLDVMYRAFVPGQADPQLQKRIVDLENEVEQVFNMFRSRIRKETLTENEVRAILTNTTDSAAAEAAWKAYMKVGQTVADKLRELVDLRNEMARQLGFSNFYSMRLTLQEIDEQELFRLLDELNVLTAAPFAKLKHDLDAARAARFRIPVADLRPWHFGDLFFQDAPGSEDVNLDRLFQDADMIELSRRYYGSIGLPCDDILAHSDLYEKPGKCPHAYCRDMNRAGDVRVLANLKPNLYWADTMLHELGHGVYDKYIGVDVPFLLHTVSHGITTEGIAMMFGAMSKNEEWLTQVLQVDSQEAPRIGRAARAVRRAEKLMFSRWAQVMVRFERSMYAKPHQDFGRLWWDLKNRYQLLNPPERVDRPDYAAKVHILTSPVYYHSYMLGELFAAQVRTHIAREVLGLTEADCTSFHNRPEVGAYLRAKVFGPGNLYPWNELTQRATGSPLSAKDFAAGLGE